MAELTRNAIMRLLDEAGDGNVNAEMLLAYLHKSPLEIHDADNFDDYEFQAFAAAFDYYARASKPFIDVLRNAAEVIASGVYTFYPDVQDDFALGEARLAEDYGGDNFPQIINDYFDFAHCGEDFADDTNGRFTRYGFFAPERID